MAQYQLAPLKDERQFEEFVCDLFNEIEKTDSYRNTDFQTFGTRGQAQHGIDILSPKTRTVIQCKVKDVRKRDELIRRSLIADMEADLANCNNLGFGFDRFILASTFRDDSILQQHAAKLQEELQLSFHIYYWGWDTLSKYAEQYTGILEKYFPKFIPKPAKAVKKAVLELPEGALGKDLLKKNYVSYLSKRYGDWKQLQFDREGKGEKFNWASHNKSLMNRYHAAGINHIHTGHFDDIVSYLQDRIDKTIFGRNQKAKGKRNYSAFDEHTRGILE